MKRFLLIFLLVPSLALATDFDDTDQLYGWDSATGQFYQTWIDHKTQLSLIYHPLDTSLTTSGNPSFNSVHASGGNLAASNAQVTKKWITGLTYTADVTSVIHGGAHYICSANHTAGASTEPGVGASWATVWDIVQGLNTSSNYTLTGDWTFQGNVDLPSDIVLPASAVAGSQTGVHATPSTTNPLAPTWTTSMHVVWYGATGEIDLPVAASYTGRGILIYNTGAFTITIDPNASEVIVRTGTVQTGGVSMTLSTGAGNYVALVSDGARWVTVGYLGTLGEGS